MKSFIVNNLVTGNAIMMTIYKQIIRNIGIAPIPITGIKVVLDRQIPRPTKVML